MRIGDVRAWSPERLDGVAEQLDTRIAALVARQDQLDAGTRPREWTGAAATAATAHHRRIAEALRRLVAQLAAVRTATGVASAGAAAVGRALAETELLAARHHYAVDDDNHVRDVAPEGLLLDTHAAGDRLRMLAEVIDRTAQVLRAAADVDAELTRVLWVAAHDEVDDGPAVALTAAMSRGATQGADLSVLRPVPGASPAAQNAYWDALPAADRRAMLRTDAALVGNLDGLPAATRSTANRARLPGELSRARREHAAALAARTRVMLGSGRGDDVALGRGADVALGRRADVALGRRADVALGRRADVALGRRVDELAARVRALEAVEAVPADRQLLLLDTSGPVVLAASAVGDVDTAEHVSTHVPGMSGTVGATLVGRDREMAALRSVAHQQLEAAGRGDERVAAITWIGYDAPGWGDFVDADRDDTALSRRPAERAAPVLAGFVDGIDAARVADPDSTLLGHSYGSLVAGLALDTPTGVDRAVVYGSPGLGTDSLRTLDLPPGRLYVAEARDDLIADSGVFGTDPSRLDGVLRLSTERSTTSDGTVLAESSGHSEYTADATTSQHEVAAVVAGPHR